MQRSTVVDAYANFTTVTTSTPSIPMMAACYAISNGSTVSTVERLPASTSVPQLRPPGPTLTVNVHAPPFHVHGPPFHVRRTPPHRYSTSRTPNAPRRNRNQLGDATGVPHVAIGVHQTYVTPVTPIGQRSPIATLTRNDHQPHHQRPHLRDRDDRLIRVNNGDERWQTQIPTPHNSGSDDR